MSLTTPGQRFRAGTEQRPRFGEGGFGMPEADDGSGLHEGVDDAFF